MRHGREQGVVQPQAPLGDPLGVTAGAEIAVLAGEGEQILVGAGVAANPGKAVFEHAAGEKLVDDLGDDGAPVAVGGSEALIPDEAQLPKPLVEEPIQRRCPGLARAIDPGWCVRW